LTMGSSLNPIVELASLILGQMPAVGSWPFFDRE